LKRVSRLLKHKTSSLYWNIKIFLHMITKFLLFQISIEIPKRTVTEIVTGIVGGTEAGTQGVHVKVVDRE
jgi:hypothetical protein